MEDAARDLVEKKMRTAMLFSFYGGLLTTNQREMARLYYEEDLSLSEIARQMDMTRQGAHDALTRVRNQLDRHEEALGLYARFTRTRERLLTLKELLNGIAPAPEQKEARAAIDALIERMLSEEEE